MIKTLYNSVAGMLTDDRRINTIATNISNVNTTGFKRQIMMANEYSNEKDKTARPLTRTYFDFTQGSMRPSTGKYDFAINGDGFMKVQLPNGEAGYSRGGSLGVNQNGILVTNEGLPILALNKGTNEEEFVYVNTQDLNVNEDGTFRLNGNDYSFNFVTFDNLQNLERYADNVFRTNDTPIMANGNTKIYHGFLETSNVDISMEYSEMILANRSLQSSYNAFKNVDELVAKSIEEVGKL